MRSLHGSASGSCGVHKGHRQWLWYCHASSFSPWLLDKPRVKCIEDAGCVCFFARPRQPVAKLTGPFPCSLLVLEMFAPETISYGDFSTFGRQLSQANNPYSGDALLCFCGCFYHFPPFTLSTWRCLSERFRAPFRFCCSGRPVSEGALPAKDLLLWLYCPNGHVLCLGWWAHTAEPGLRHSGDWPKCTRIEMPSRLLLDVARRSRSSSDGWVSIAGTRFLKQRQLGYISR